MHLEASKIDFIVIDDSKIDCFIAEKVIQYSGLSRNCKIFQHPPMALEYIEQTPNKEDITIVLIDEQMPLMNGFEFAEAFSKLNLVNREYYRLYILTSSINDGKLFDARYDAVVEQYLNKPLTAGIIYSLYEKTLNEFDNG